ncbi:autophagy protein Apg9-domain-containing protein [Limtongia smithiae]|uniref:autophagy protein Apg9-domain-containing protein n=1 Tax=Limtongia smithiae TaxID=1125753 RepID=UPI0034CF8B30
MTTTTTNGVLARMFGRDSVYHDLQSHDDNLYREPDVEANFGMFESDPPVHRRSNGTAAGSAGSTYSTYSSSAGLPSVADLNEADENEGDDEPSPDLIVDRGATYPPATMHLSHSIVPDVSSPATSTTNPQRQPILEEDHDEVPPSIMFEQPRATQQAYASFSSSAARLRRNPSGNEGWHPSRAEMSFRYMNKSWFGGPHGIGNYPAPPPPTELPAPPADISPRPPKWINLESSYLAPGVAAAAAAATSSQSLTQNLPPPPSRIDAAWPASRTTSDGTAAQQQNEDEVIRFGINDARARAVWKWANVKDLDNFLTEVYEYYNGKGMYNIIVTRIINLATLAFVVGFTTYLSSCVNYSMLKSSHHLSEVQVPYCTSQLGAFTTFCLWVLSLVWFAKLAEYLIDIQRLLHIQEFYYHLLGITVRDIQTISWTQVAERLMMLRDDNPLTSASAQRRYMGHVSRQRMEERDIAHRIMRKDNYYIAMFDKDILDLSIPLPFCRRFKWLTRSLMFNLDVCIMAYVFNKQGQVNSMFLRYDNRKKLSEALRRRFMIVGVFNLIFGPFLMVYLALLNFFRYFDEYYKNPGTINTRQYSSFAEWKFREYNELYHSFRNRLDLSCYPATEYVNSFPKEMTNQILRFVVIVCGAFAAVLAVASIMDPELFMFEITPERNVLFYIGVFGSFLAAARGMIQDERLVYDPEENLRFVARYTHYLPAQWTGRLHTEAVRDEFTQYYCLKIVLLVQEMLSMVLTPFVLWFSLANCSERIVDFFRDCSLYEDGLGYVCAFAVYDFSKEPRLRGTAHDE